MVVYSDFVSKFFLTLDGLLKSYVYDGYHALSSAMQAPLAAIATLYIVILGLCVMNGWVKVNMGTFIKAVVKIGFIYTAATHWDWVSDTIVHTIYAAVDDLTGALISATPLHIPGFSSVEAALQEVFMEFMIIAKLFYKSGGLSNLSAFFQGFLIQMMGYIMVGVALFEIALAKIMLAILFVLLPVFVCFCFFESTKGFFDRYVGMIASHAFVLVMVNAVLVLGLQLVYWAFPVLQGQSALKIGVLGVAPMMLVGFIVIATLIKISGVAHSLGGSISSASGSAMLGGMVGSAVGSSMKGVGIISGARRGVASKLKRSDATDMKAEMKAAIKDVRSALRGK